MGNLEDRLYSVKYHKPEGNIVAAHERLRVFAAEIVTFLDENVPLGREQALAFTKMEEMLMWAHKAIALSKQ